MMGRQKRQPDFYNKISILHGKNGGERGTLRQFPDSAFKISGLAARNRLDSPISGTLAGTFGSRKPARTASDLA
jgi:hypothetical protein